MTALANAPQNNTRLIDVAIFYILMGHDGDDCIHLLGLSIVDACASSPDGILLAHGCDGESDEDARPWGHGVQRRRRDAVAVRARLLVGTGRSGAAGVVRGTKAGLGQNRPHQQQHAGPYLEDRAFCCPIAKQAQCGAPENP